MLSLVKSNSTFQASWKEYSKNSNIIQEIKKPKLLRFDNQTNLDISEQPVKKKCSKLWLSFLQSNLQKAMRRKKIDVALSSAEEMISYQNGWTKLIRRLGIIIVEDKLTALDDNYSVLLWLTAVTPRYNSELKDWLFSYINFLITQNHATVNSIKLKGSSNLKKSILVRSYYGGMPGDVNLLKLIHKNIEETNVLEYPLKILPALPKQKLILLWYAADFHVFPDIFKKLNSKYSDDILKKAMWWNSSGIRKDFDNEKKYVEIWNEIKPQLKDICMKEINLMIGCLT